MSAVDEVESSGADEAVSKTIALQETGRKYNKSKNNKPGPDPVATNVAEDACVQFISNKEKENKAEEDALDNLKAMGDKENVKCCYYSGDHLTTKYSFKDALLAGKLNEKKSEGLGPVSTGAGMSSDDKSKPQNGKCILPSLRNRGKKKRDRLSKPRARDNSICVSNLSESITHADLIDLVKEFGVFKKMYIAKDKNSGLCEGFAYINTKKYHVFAPMGRFQLESIYLYFPPSSQLLYLCFCPVGLSLL